MEVIELVEEMQNICEKLRQSGKLISFVPTMGALHNGHASLIQFANNEVDYKDDKTSHETFNSASDASAFPDQTYREDAKSSVRILNSERNVVIVSIFVNPKQFNNPADFNKYHGLSSMESDLNLCRSLDVSYVFAPKVDDIYHEKEVGIDLKGSTQSCLVLPPTNLASILEGKSRPGHFEGMLTIVCKLFNIIRPYVAYFGEKDYQQLILVSKMVRDLNMNIRIRGVKTVRNLDMLPLSSRNVRLSERERRLAPLMHDILLDLKQTLESKGVVGSKKDEAQRQKIMLYTSSLITLLMNADKEDEYLFNIDYLELRCAKDLSEISYQEASNYSDCQEGCVRNQLYAGQSSVLKARLLISVIVGETRLLDNTEIRLNMDRLEPICEVNCKDY